MVYFLSLRALSGVVDSGVGFRRVVMTRAGRQALIHFVSHYLEGLSDLAQLFIAIVLISSKEHCIGWHRKVIHSSLRHCRACRIAIRDTSNNVHSPSRRTSHKGT